MSTNIDAAADVVFVVVVVLDPMVDAVAQPGRE